MNEEDIDDNGAGSIPSEDEFKCVKLQIPEHMAAYLEKRELSRDVEALVCDKSLMEKITANYVIVKKILSNLAWKDKLLCKHVCSMWHSIVTTLQKEQLNPADFSINLRITNIRHGINYLKSSNFYTEPLVVFTFSNTNGSVTSHRCESLIPSPCEPTCEMEHYIIDMVDQDVAAPKNCMFVVQALYLSYLPLPNSITYENALRHKLFLKREAFIAGVYIPVIPNVKFTTISLKSLTSVQEKFCDVLDKLAQTHIIKGALVFANDTFLLNTVEDITFLNYFKDVQPNVPYALGGCLVEDSIPDQKAIMNDIIDGLNEGTTHRDYGNDSLITIGLFSVPKDVQEHSSNFDMFSCILESSDWTKQKIQSSINQFAKSVPHFEHSVAIKLSCVGRDQKHEVEQQYFRVAFPNTRLVGCYGNGELGVNHPARPVDEESPSTAKRHRADPGPQFGVMHSYSTVFVYIGWGKILIPPETT